jgi:hypothetical protein
MYSCFFICEGKIGPQKEKVNLIVYCFYSPTTVKITLAYDTLESDSDFT